MHHCCHILVFLWWSNDTISHLCRLRHFLLRYWICSAHFKRALLNFSCVFCEWLLYLYTWFHLFTLNPSKQYQVLRMCLPQHQLVGKPCWEHSCRALAMVTSALVPVWFQAWTPSAPILCVCLSRCDHRVGDAFTAPGWRSSHVWSESKFFITVSFTQVLVVPASLSFA